MAAADVFKLLKDNDVKFVDLRFTDTRGKEQHVSVPVRAFGPEKFEDGHAFDGSSIAGWKGIQASDMLLMPDPDSARLDPFSDEPTLNITCDVIEPTDGKGYDRDPRTIAKRAEAYLKSTGIGDTAVLSGTGWIGSSSATVRPSRSLICVTKMPNARAPLISLIEPGCNAKSTKNGGSWIYVLLLSHS